MLFQPNFEVVDNFSPLASIADLAEETGVYSASPDFVRSNCGPLANSILDRVPEDYYTRAEELGLYPNIDIRIHRLYPGDFPAYPGWHTDGEYRETYHSQPELGVVPNHDHIIGSISSEVGGVSNTVILASPYEFQESEHKKATAENPFWGMVHRDIESCPELNRFRTEDGQLIRMDANTLHKATPAKTRGWRLFFRLSMWHKPYLEGEGKISRQEQVYQITEGHGW